MVEHEYHCLCSKSLYMFISPHVTVRLIPQYIKQLTFDYIKVTPLSPRKPSLLKCIFLIFIALICSDIFHVFSSATRLPEVTNLWRTLILRVNHSDICPLIILVKHLLIFVTASAGFLVPQISYTAFVCLLIYLFIC